MTVRLLAHTAWPEKVVAAAAKECYSSSDPDMLFDGLTNEKAGEFLDKLNDLGHASPTEHASFTFSISGVSRSLLAQITRHRIASFSVRSQRYVNMGNADAVVPPAIANNVDALEVFNNTMTQCQMAYRLIQNILSDEYVDGGMDTRSAAKKAQEDARFVLPEATCTSMMVTMNARELNSFFALRCCNRAQWEIRAVADEMFKQVYKVAPSLFKNAGPSCIRGRCSESGMSCGKSSEMREHFRAMKGEA